MKFNLIYHKHITGYDRTGYINLIDNALELDGARSETNIEIENQELIDDAFDPNETINESNVDLQNQDLSQNLTEIDLETVRISLKKALEKIDQALCPEYAEELMRFSKRINKTETLASLISVIATAGSKNKILRIQSRKKIGKNSLKNRFYYAAKQKLISKKRRCLSNAIKNNTRNKSTQEKK